jgi:hypothetical protein
MTENDVAWATTHFEPDLRVVIQGLSAAEEARLVARPIPTNRQIIGQWVDDGPLASLVTIFREAGKMYFSRTSRDGTEVLKEVVEKRSSLGRRSDKVEGSSAGGHYIIDSNGDLQSHDNEA